MNDQNARLDKALAVFKAINETVTPAEFVRAFKAVVSVIKQAERDLNAKIDARLALIRDGKDGRDGRDGKDGETVVGPKGPQGEPGESIPGPAGKDGEDGSPDTAEDIRNKLETLKGTPSALNIDAIFDLERRLDELQKGIDRKGGGGGTTFAIQRGAILLYDLSSLLDGSKKTFTLPAFWRVLTVQSTSTPNAFRPVVDYTTDASVPSITFTSQIDAPSTLAAGQTVTILYASP